MRLGNLPNRPHLRCGVCQEPLERGEPTTWVDDERVHRTCAELEAQGEVYMDIADAAADGGWDEAA